jgi:hypothetical protein
MGRRIKKFPRQQVIRDIQGIVRTFPSSFVAIERAGYVQDPDTGEQFKVLVIIWQGELHIRRVTATVQRLEMGQILTDTFAILVPGEHDIREGDFVRILENPYWATNHPVPVGETFFQIQRVANPFGAYNVAELNRYQQGEGPEAAALSGMMRVNLQQFHQMKVEHVTPIDGNGN